jgi:dTDP-4-dehydrorhamnose 3,5-epimerase-like enzyme
LKPQLIKGGRHTDERGMMTFVNELDMSSVKRFYSITPANTSVVRAWQGHQKEAKWFHALSGKFLVRLIEPDNWLHPTPNLPFSEFILTTDICEVLHIPGGYINGFQSIVENSSLLVYSDTTLEESKGDDYRFEQNYWFDWHKITLQ